MSNFNQNLINGFCQLPRLDLKIESNAERGRRKRAKMA